MMRFLLNRDVHFAEVAHGSRSGQRKINLPCAVKIERERKQNMDRAYAMKEDVVSFISDWRFQKKLAEGSSGERRYLDERAELRRQQRQLEYEREEFLRAKAFEEKRMEKEKRIFDMEWQMLEEGWRSLAAEREQLDRFRSAEDGESSDFLFTDISGSLLFSGVRNMRSLKKRYKELIKIFHPDNGSGDTEVLHIINEEYETLKRSLEAPKSRIYQG